MSDQGIKLFNPHTLKEGVIFPVANGKENLEKFVIAPFSASMLVFQKQKMILLELTQLRNRLENLKAQMFLAAAPSIAKDVAGIMAAYTTLNPS